MTKLPEPYYHDEEAGITIYCGDNRCILPKLSSVDVCLTDPPYSDVTHKGARTVTCTRTLVNFSPTTAKELSETLGLICIKRWCVATVDWSHVLSLESNPPKGLKFVRFGIWVKPNGAPQFTGDRPATGWEAVAILHGDNEKMHWNGGGHHAVWRNNKENTSHPTGKPLDLIQRFVSLFSDEGETIIDPYMGSGTTLVAAKLEGRRAIGIEISEEYCEIAVNRLRQGVLFGLDTGA